MCENLMCQVCLGLEGINDDLFRLDYCVGKILELSAVTTDTQERIFEFAQSRPEIYSCADIACDYSSRLKSALESMKNQLSGCEWQYAKSGFAEAEIILDSNNYLIDGYIWYLLAQSYGLTHVPVRYGRRQIITAAHKVGGKLYRWELPGMLVGRVHPGDKVKIRTCRGIRTVRVAGVEEYAGEPEPLRMVIRKYGKRCGRKADYREKESHRYSTSNDVADYK